jgi:surfeit locus 1 family protein
VTRRVPVVATLIVIAAAAAMVALGFWQLHRAEWKAELIARYQAAQSLSADVPWPRTDASSSTRCSLERLHLRAGPRHARDRGDQRGGPRASPRSPAARSRRRRGEVALGWSTPAADGALAGGRGCRDDRAGRCASRGAVLPGLERLAPPDPSDLPNNHLMYAGQWFFFA